MSNVLVIPARAGSKGIKNKNVSKVNGIPLVVRAATVASESEFDEVYVYTDCEKVTAAINSSSISSCWVIARPPCVSLDDTSSEDTIRRFINQTDPDEEIEFLGLMQCTTPFISSSVINRALEAVVEYSGMFDSALSACPFHRWVGDVEETIRANTIDPTMDRPEFSFSDQCVFIPERSGKGRTPRRQDKPLRAMENGGIYIARREAWMSGSRYGESPFISWMGWYESIEIDNEDDLAIANVLASNYFCLEDR